MLTIDDIKEAGIDYDNGVKRFAGQKKLFLKFLAKFPQDPNFDGIKTSLAQKDYEQTFRYAHALKGVAGNLSITKLYNGCQPLVEALRSNQIDHADTMFADLELEYNKLIQFLERLKEEL